MALSRLACGPAWPRPGLRAGLRGRVRTCVQACVRPPRAACGLACGSARAACGFARPILRPPPPSAPFGSALSRMGNWGKGTKSLAHIRGLRQVLAHLSSTRDLSLLESHNCRLLETELRRMPLGLLCSPALRQMGVVAEGHTGVGVAQLLR